MRKHWYNQKMKGIKAEKWCKINQVKIYGIESKRVQKERVREREIDKEDEEYIDEYDTEFFQIFKD